jgi:hypothetical protein
MTPALLALDISCHIYSLAGLDTHCLIYDSHLAGMTDVLYYAQLLLVQMGVSQTFPLQDWPPKP